MLFFRLRCSFKMVMVFIVLVTVTTINSNSESQDIKKLDDYTIVGENNFLDIAEPLNDDNTINAIIEIPTGTVAKWEVTKPDGKLE